MSRDRYAPAMADDDSPNEIPARAINPRDITPRKVFPEADSRREVSQRIRDAVTAITIPAGARVLEVGCGDGMAVALVCEQLGDDGSIVAIDRSPTETAATGERNDKHLIAGRLEVRTARLARASLDAGSFDLIYGINVRDMWSDKPTARLLRAALAPEGRLWAIMQLPPGRDATGLDATIAGRLEALGFHVVQSGVFDEDMTPGCWVECSAG
jgi:cyclopropane fatty-acyl-phospholipid synthase-like methyltransferase